MLQQPHMGKTPTSTSAKEHRRFLMSEPYQGQSTNTGVPGVSGTNTAESGVGVRGDSNAVGVWGEGKNWHGVVGASHSTIGGAGVFGSCDSGVGVFGESKLSHAVQGRSGSTNGTAGVSGEHTGAGPGIFGKSASGPAGFFEGKVTVTGDLTAHDVFVAGGDCAEEFDIAEAVEREPGMVMVLNQAGTLQPGQQAYDKRVAGVISGAGAYKPGLILDKRGSSEGRMPIALVGKVYCQVDAQYASIEIGDLLTTSPTPGHAMKASDPFKAFGAVVGKALSSLDAGQGLIPILIALQ
jgi:hypothetical protein